MSAPLFIDNKYTRIYYAIIKQAKDRSTPEGYFEKHHIIPQSFYKAKNKTGWLPGDHNAKKNLVNLTAKEHYICHLLLTKMTEGEAYFKMVHALMRLANGIRTKEYVSAERYDSAKKLLSEARKGRPCSLETREKIRQGNLVREPISEETREKLRAAAHRRKGFTPEGLQNVINAQRGKVLSEETKEKLRAARQRQVEKQGDTMSAEARLKLSKAAKGRVLSEDHKRKISESQIGKTMSDEAKLKMRASAIGRQLSSKTKDLLSQKAKGIPKKNLTCPHCNLTGGEPQMKRWHFDKCKSLVVNI